MVPTTALDPRDSNPEAVAVGWEETQRILQTAELFWISIVRADGRPHVTTVATCGTRWRLSPHRRGCSQRSLFRDAYQDLRPREGRSLRPTRHRF